MELADESDAVHNGDNEPPEERNGQTPSQKWPNPPLTWLLFTETGRGSESPGSEHLTRPAERPRLAAGVGNFGFSVQLAERRLKRLKKCYHTCGKRLTGGFY